MPERLPRGSTTLLAAIFVGQLAVSVQVTAAGIQVFDITGSTFALGLIGLVEFLPNLLLAPVVGSIADRFDRRRVAAVGLGVEAACGLGLAAYAATDPTSIGPLLGLVAAFGVARAILAPATRSLPADLASSAQLARLVPRTSATWQIASIIGPASCGFLYAVGVPVPYLVSAVAALTAAVIFSMVPRPRSTGPAPVAAGRELVRDALQGVHFVRRSPILLGAIALDLFAVLFGGAVALIPAIAEERLGVGEIGIGWLRAAVGIGAGTMTLALALRPVRRRVGRVLLVSVAMFGVLTILFGATTNYAVAFVAMLGLAAADAVSVIIRGTLVPLVTPPTMRGRVLAVENVFIGASNELGAFESGALGALIGAPAAVVAGGAAVVGIVAVWWRRFPVLRDVDTYADVATTGAPAPGPDPRDVSSEPVP